MVAHTRLLASVVACFLSLAAPARAEDPATPEGVEVTRGGPELQALAATKAAARSGVETALIFTNAGGNELRVLCAAVDAEGGVVGHAWTRVPARGLRFLLASDLSGGADFAGQAECATFGRVVPSGLLLTPSGIAGVGVERYRAMNADFVRFTVTASH